MKFINRLNGIVDKTKILQQVAEPKDPLIILPQRKKKWDLVSELRKQNTHNWEIQEIPHELSFSIKGFHRKKIQKINSRLALLGHSLSLNFRRKALNKFKITFIDDHLIKIKQDLKSIKYCG